jgi:hypothetical protein
MLLLIGSIVPLYPQIRKEWRQFSCKRTRKISEEQLAVAEDEKFFIDLKKRKDSPVDISIKSSDTSSEFKS